jgi:hypothetical protein
LATSSPGPAARLSAWAAARGEGWKALLALLVVDLVDTGLTDTLTIEGHLLSAPGPSADEFRLAVSVLVLGAGLIAWSLGLERAVRRIVSAYLCVDTSQLVFGLALLVLDLPNFKALPGGFLLLGDVILVWVMNIALFGIWYWLLDGGGPWRRGRAETTRRDFVFVQHTTPHPGWSGWTPGFVDYLFLSFNASVTFGPTDTLVLSGRAKILMMAQVVTSLTSFAVLAARAVSILS